MENTFCQWFGGNKTVSVVNIDSKMMLQMFETSFCVSGAALVCCSGQMVLWKIKKKKRYSLLHKHLFDPSKLYNASPYFDRATLHFIELQDDGAGILFLLFSIYFIFLFFMQSFQTRNQIFIVAMLIEFSFCCHVDRLCCVC